MKKFGKFIVKYRILILLLSVVLVIPSIFGYLNTKINYDILSYLPDDVETMKGQQILIDQFGTGAFSMVVVEGMENKDIASLKEKIEDVQGVSKVIWYNSVLDLSVPMEMLPKDMYEAFNKDDATIMAVIFKDGTSADETMDAIATIRTLADKQVFVSGISATVTDIKAIFNKEMTAYVAIAALASLIVMGLAMDSYLIPVFFLLSIGLAIIYNLGSNVFLGEISYITKALSAVLQLGVTMDYSIFLWHSYEEQLDRFDGDRDRSMAHAIGNTIVSIVSSSITTVAGFLALCCMSFTLGSDIGIVMAKGVVFGVILCVTVLPSLILVFEKPIQKTRHKAILPDFGGIAGFVIKHYKIFAIIFLIVVGPAFYGQNHAKVYYDLAGTLPGSLDSVKANKEIKDKFNMNSTHMVLVDSKLDSKTIDKLLDDIKEIDGVKAALSMESAVGPALPTEMIPSKISNDLKSDEYEMLVVTSEYSTGTDEVNDQCTKIQDVIKKYDPKAMLLGEAPCTKDLITITDHDFQVVSIVSIAAIFIIIAVVFKSISLPIVLVAAIEFAIFINMGIPCFTGTEIPFIASVVIGTIQLGATVDYAILMTTRYRKERNSGKSKHDSVEIALGTSTKSVISSALSFFGATVGVGLYSNIDMISSLCILMARGAIISMVVVLTVLPAFFMIFDRVIVKTSVSFDSKAAFGAK